MFRLESPLSTPKRPLRGSGRSARASPANFAIKRPALACVITTTLWQTSLALPAD
jgi:hypothetical protein